MKIEKTLIEKVEDWFYWTCIFGLGYAILLFIVVARLSQ